MQPALPRLMQWVNQSLGLKLAFARRSLLSVRLLKTLTAALLVLAWLPAASLCLIESAGLIEKGDCCSKDSDHPAPGKTGCDKPCGVIAAGNYLFQQDHFVLSAPVVETPDFCTPTALEIRSPAGAGRDAPATAPPELVGCWQFSFRTALPPRAPSFVS
jgi:hypothetical protein